MQSDNTGVIVPLDRRFPAWFFFPMFFASHIGRRGREAIGPLIGIAMVIYFAYHAVQGDRGLITWWHLRYEITQAEAEQARWAKQRAELDHRVSLLRPESLDPDLLEERSRQMLNVGRPGELVILLPDH